MQSQPSKFKFTRPSQDLDTLSFSSTKPKLFKDWVEMLPKANVGETSKRLYQALKEINRLKIAEKERFALLELLYPVVNYVCNLLAPHYLNQPLILPIKAQKVSHLASSLQSQLATAYTSVVTWFQLQRSSKETAKIATLAIDRAMTCHNQILLRSYQLYLPPPDTTWQSLYALFSVAEHSDLENRPLNPTAPTWSANSIKHTFTRALLMATCKPNMLRQNEIALVYKATLNWALWAELCEEEDLFGLFKIDLTSNYAPSYLDGDSHDETQTDTNSAFRSLFTADLVPRLNAFIHNAPPQSGPNDEFQLPENIQQSLLKHLISVWDTSRKRSFDRTQTSGTLELCVGFSALYYYISEGKDFDTQLRGGKASNLLESDDNRFLNPSGSPHKQPYREEVKTSSDVWSLAFDAGANEINKSTDFNPDLLSVDNIDKQLTEEASAQQSKSYPSYQCDMVDTSPGGYCIGWMKQIPPQVRTGEIIGIKEPCHKHWAIGVIRWVTQAGNNKAKLGIELISPQAQPCGAKIIQKTGKDNYYMRALKLPAIKAIDQPASILTPNFTYRPNTKITINQQGQERRASLTEQIDTTAGYSQFTYKHLDPEKTPEPGTDSKKTSQQESDDFDTLWNSL
ncbi:MAG: hypothetical protein COB04_17040 [Gammaproteobacteria bacterium]|nr:MAG: hypothetical protein COB04_17040 [Gammaproteobacteria bacterium]